MKILYVDDNGIDQTIMRIVLKSLEAELITADDADDAILLIKQELPNLVITDLTLFGAGNGLDLLKEIKRDNQLKHIPVIILTASIDEMDKKNAIELGALAYLSKPINLQNLLNIISG